MIRAVCFNKHVFQNNVLQDILFRTGAEMQGTLYKDAPVNCIESFEDGQVYFSYCSPEELKGGKIFNCHNDIEKFIYVNSYKKGENHAVVE